MDCLSGVATKEHRARIHVFVGPYALLNQSVVHRLIDQSINHSVIEEIFHLSSHLLWRQNGLVRPMIREGPPYFAGMRILTIGSAE